MADSQLVATAGEHFVAYKVASLGFVPALVRQGIRGIDLLATNADGGKTVGLQIKSSASAIYEKEKRLGGESFYLRFPLGHRALAAANNLTIFCFVDLRRLSPREGPDVYVMSAKQLKKEYDGVYLRKYSSVQHDRSLAEMEQYRNNWQPLIDALSDEEEAEKLAPAVLPDEPLRYEIPTPAIARF